MSLRPGPVGGNSSAAPAQQSATVNPATCGAMLTLDMSDIYLESGKSAATTIYAVAVDGDQIALYDGEGWQSRTLTSGTVAAEVTGTRTCTTTNGSAAVTLTSGDTRGLCPGMKVAGTGIPVGATISAITGPTTLTLSANATATGSATLTYRDPANTGIDVWGYWSESYADVVYEKLYWTNQTTRATGFAWQNGVRVKAGDPTRRLIGSYSTTSTDGQTEFAHGGLGTLGSPASYLLSNVTHPLPIKARVGDSSTSSHTYSTATVRGWGGDNKMRCTIFQAISRWIEIDGTALLQTSATGTNASAGIGYNTTTAISGGSPAFTQIGGAHAQAAPFQFTQRQPAGLAYYQLNQRGEGTGTQTFYGNGNDPNRFQTLMRVKAEV